MAVPGNPATGAAVLFGLRRELSLGVPDTTKTREWWKLDLPANAELVRTLQAAVEADPYGFGTRGMPAAITAPLDLAPPLTAANSVPILEHILGGRGVMTKSTLETGVYQYDGVPTRLTGDTSFDAIFNLPPIARYRFFGLKFGQLTIPIGNQQESVARMTGSMMGGTRCSISTQSSGTGTYTKGPDCRGPVKRPRTGGKIKMKVTATSPLAVKIDRIPTGGTATFPGAAIAVQSDSSGFGDWQNGECSYQLTGTVSVTASTTAVTGVGTAFLSEVRVGQGGPAIRIGSEEIAVASVASDTALTLATAHSAGASGVTAHLMRQDIGFFDENRDTWDFIFPGATSGWSTLAVNDVFSFDEIGTTDPTPTYITAQRFTSAHWTPYWRRQGASTWNRLTVLTGNIVIPNALAALQGWGSRYPLNITRGAVLLPTIQAVREYTDTSMEELYEGGEPFEMYLIAEGRKLGLGTYRESIRLTGLAAELTTKPRPVSGPNAVQETLNITLKASESGATPLTTTTITDRDYTVAT